MDQSKPPHTVAVITFNYDTAVDFALERAGLTVIYGLCGDDRSQPEGKRVPLLKLHGSISWGLFEDNGEKRWCR